MEQIVRPLHWDAHQLILLDQRKLPLEEIYFKVQAIEDCFVAIKDMIVRGAPLIGFTAIWGMVLWAKKNPRKSTDEFKQAAEYLMSARPTAVNLEYELRRCIQLRLGHLGSGEELVGKLISFAQGEMDLLYSKNLTMAKLALDELDSRIGKSRYRLMTLCNTGVLACGPMGTALGVISYAFEKERIEHVYASETRPYLQGARLTAYELTKLQIPHELVVEGAASYLLRNKLVDAIFVGADRIVGNGDTANKIGTSTLSIVAHHYGVPFYVVAPVSSFDLSKKSGQEIEIELRSPDEILFCQGQRVAPYGSTALNPSFDVTSGDLIEGIFCEKGLIRPKVSEDVKRVLSCK